MKPLRNNNLKPSFLKRTVVGFTTGFALQGLFLSLCFGQVTQSTPPSPSPYQEYYEGVYGEESAAAAEQASNESAANSSIASMHSDLSYEQLLDYFVGPGTAAAYIASLNPSSLIQPTTSIPSNTPSLDAGNAKPNSPGPTHADQ